MAAGPLGIVKAGSWKSSLEMINQDTLSSLNGRAIDVVI
jgi:hypothetical protein